MKKIACQVILAVALLAAVVFGGCEPPPDEVAPGATTIDPTAKASPSQTNIVDVERMAPHPSSGATPEGTCPFVRTHRFFIGGTVYQNGPSINVYCVDIYAVANVKFRMSFSIGASWLYLQEEVELWLETSMMYSAHIDSSSRTNWKEFELIEFKTLFQMKTKEELVICLKTDPKKLPGGNHQIYANLAGLAGCKNPQVPVFGPRVLLSSGTTNVPEVCDGKDNDGNGLVDDGAMPGVGLPCVTPVFDSKTGKLWHETGKYACLNGGIRCQRVCTSQEICDGFDNTCDGHVDEGCTTQP